MGCQKDVVYCIVLYCNRLLQADKLTFQSKTETRNAIAEEYTQKFIQKG